MNTKKITCKRFYTSLCEVHDEFNKNLKTLQSDFNAEVQKNRSQYIAYANADHSDEGPHRHAFNGICLGGGYEGHVDVDWPSKKLKLAKAISKEFTLIVMQEIEEMTVVYAHFLNMDEPMFVFFTSVFFDDWGDCTKLESDFVFTQHCNDGFLSFCENDCRIISPVGMAYGHRICRFCVFDGFSDLKSCPEDMTSCDEEELFDMIWDD